MLAVEDEEVGGGASLEQRLGQRAQAFGAARPLRLATAVSTPRRRLAPLPALLAGRAAIAREPWPQGEGGDESNTIFGPL